MRGHILLLTAWALVLAAVATPASAATVVYYDGPPAADSNIILANMTLNMAGHFDDDVIVAAVDDYQPGELEVFDNAFYIGTSCLTLPEDFVADVAAGTRPVFWIGANAEQVLAVPGAADRLGLRFGGYEVGDGYTAISYKGRTATRQIVLGFFRLVPSAGAEVLATLKQPATPTNTAPYAVASGNFFYLADIPYYNQAGDDRYLVFADVLHEFYDTGAGTSKLAMVRLEDMAPGVTNLTALKKVVDGLYSRGVPFSFDITAIFRDPSGVYFPAGTEYRLSQKPTFVKMIRYMLARRGTLVMHGVTHQHDQGVSLDDWEFVDASYFKPLPYDSQEWVEDRLAEGLAEFAAVGLDPEIWETPHYAASHGDYKTFAQAFAVAYERPLLFPLEPSAPPVFAEPIAGSSQLILYYTSLSASGPALLPENLGYVDLTEPNYNAPTMLAKADHLSIVRDGVPSFFFHAGDAPIAQLWKLVDGLKARGYRFVSPAELMAQ